MTKLKTLKDLKFKGHDDFNFEIVDYNKLKQEAIKRAKKLYIEMTYYDWLKFFNITEEDLKEKKDE